ncbi:hypothetical protein PR048_001387 [Dryococelus australis]|uniref:Transposase n=1 Tax=Dryococelus australis TaxID=614101 RepID=A0ABQ9II77_9NEOP|nr:hypothetical protein PR048_001387 [Dryococelus australis]
MHGVSAASVARIVHSVVDAVNEIEFPEGINWPPDVYHIVANWRGFSRMDDGWRPIPNAIILADSACPLREWLITPVANVLNDRAVTRFNRAHQSTKSFEECTLDVRKEKFPALIIYAVAQHSRPTSSSAVLHYVIYPETKEKE